MPLIDLLTGQRRYGAAEMICVCGCAATWHKKIDRGCGRHSDCYNFKIAAQYKRKLPL